MSTTATHQSAQTKAHEATTTTTPVTASTTTTTITTSSAVPPIWSCDTHKRAHYQQRELKQQQLLLSTLLAELRRATHHWFQGKSHNDGDGDDATSFQLLLQTCVQILQHGLRVPPTSVASNVSHTPHPPLWGFFLRKLSISLCVIDTYVSICTYVYGIWFIYKQIAIAMTFCEGDRVISNPIVSR